MLTILIKEHNNYLRINYLQRRIIIRQNVFFFFEIVLYLINQLETLSENEQKSYFLNSLREKG